MAKVDTALRFLLLGKPELEDLLTLLFRKLSYRIGSTILANGFLLMHLIEQDPAGEVKHVLACWAGGEKNFAPHLIREILDKPPQYFEGVTFQRVMLLSPYEYSDAFEEEAKLYGVHLIKGSQLAELLLQNELDFAFPSDLEALWARIRRWLPPMAGIVAGILFLAFLVTSPLSPLNKKPSPSPTQPLASRPPKPTVTPAPNTLPQPAPTPSRSPAKPTPIASPSQTVPTPTPAPESSPAATRTPIPPRMEREKPKTPRMATAKPAVKTPSTQASPSAKGKLSEQERLARRVVRHYHNVFDLEEKYYRIARDLEHRGLKSQAGKYYRRYLTIAPQGTHAEEARATLARMKSAKKPR